eukprot:scaffold133_cov407-Prasinococcus_capsulatus_cf.AAC.6
MSRQVVGHAGQYVRSRIRTVTVATAVVAGRRFHGTKALQQASALCKCWQRWPPRAGGGGGLARIRSVSRRRGRAASILSAAAPGRVRRPAGARSFCSLRLRPAPRFIRAGAAAGAAHPMVDCIGRRRRPPPPRDESRPPASIGGRFWARLGPFGAEVGAFRRARRGAGGPGIGQCNSICGCYSHFRSARPRPRGADPCGTDLIGR